MSWLRGGADLLSAPPRQGEASASVEVGAELAPPRRTQPHHSARGTTITLLRPNHSRFEGVRAFSPAWTRFGQPQRSTGAACRLSEALKGGASDL